MNKPEYVYVTVIAKTPEEVWNALTLPEFTRQYWHRTDVQSDFEAGSPVRFLTESGSVAAEGEVLVASRPLELAYTWQFPNNPETKDEAPSRVTFKLEPIPNGTQLTVIHDQFPAGSKMLEIVRPGWPLVIGGLKTLLETDRAVDFTS